MEKYLVFKLENGDYQGDPKVMFLSARHSEEEANEFVKAYSEDKKVVTFVIKGTIFGW